MSTLTAAVPRKGAAGLRIDAFIDAIDRGALHISTALHTRIALTVFFDQPRDSTCFDLRLASLTRSPPFAFAPTTRPLLPPPPRISSSRSPSPNQARSTFCGRWGRARCSP